MRSRVAIRAGLVGLILMLVALAILPPAAFLVPEAEAVAIFRSGNCGTHRYETRDGTGSGLMIADIQFLVLPPVAYILIVDYEIRWFNITSALNGVSPSSGEVKIDYMTQTSTPAMHLETEIDTGPGMIATIMTGVVHTQLASGGQLSCRILDMPHQVTVSGTANGTTWPESQLPLPLTADTDNDNTADDNHCGNICNQKQDQLAEDQLYQRNRKVCDQYDTPRTRPEPFKMCKRSAQLSVYDNNGSKFVDEWYDQNRNGWACPTDPTNKPIGWLDGYCPGKGYNHPNLTPTPATIPTPQPPRPTPYYANCTQTSPLICENGTGIHVQSQFPSIDISLTATPTYATTLTTVPTPSVYTAELVAYPDQATIGDSMNVSWTTVPSPGSSDWLVLFDASTGVEPDSNHGQTRRWTDNCVKPNGNNHGSIAVGSGFCSIPVDAHLPQGSYEFRLYHNASTSAGNLVATSNPFTRTPSYCELNPGNCGE